VILVMLLANHDVQHLVVILVMLLANHDVQHLVVILTAKVVDFINIDLVIDRLAQEEDRRLEVIL
jgi:hypothetical protein